MRFDRPTYTAMSPKDSSSPATYSPELSCDVTRTGWGGTAREGTVHFVADVIVWASVLAQPRTTNTPTRSTSTHLRTHLRTHRCQYDTGDTGPQRTDRTAGHAAARRPRKPSRPIKRALFEQTSRETCLSVRFPHAICTS